MLSKKITSFILLLLCVSCSSFAKKEQGIPEGYVSESVAINLMGKSFFVGCMTALHARGLKSVAGECQRLSQDHAQEIREIVKEQ